MTDLTLQKSSAEAVPGMLDRVADVASTMLKPRVREIDGGQYPEDVMRAMGGAGAYGAHVAPGDVTLNDTIEAVSLAGAQCTSTAFCMWCQDALGWYIASSENESLKATLGREIASGEKLGGTGLSNPMKTFFGIETMKLKAKRVPGGYRVSGALPWVSNVGTDGHFGIVFETEDATPHRVMAVACGAWAGVKTVEDHDFVAMGGTATRAVRFRDAFIPDEYLLADPIDAYLPTIRAGFVLMQCGMAVGMIRSCIDLMYQVRGQLGHVNKYLEDQPEDYEAALATLEPEIAELAATPRDTSIPFFRRVLEARLAGGELSVSAANAAMLHQGARGYVGRGVAQRRLREAYFVAIVTPATKQLRKMLAELPAA